MASINKVILVGRLTRDVDFRTTPNGTSVCDFSIAVDSNRPANNTQENNGFYFKVTTWGKTAEFCKRNLYKKDLVGVDGSLVQRTYEDKDNVKHTVVDINATSVTLLAHKNPKPNLEEASGYAPDAAAGKDTDSVDKNVADATDAKSEEDADDKFDEVISEDTFFSN